MYILCINGKEQEGAYAITDENGVKTLVMFIEEDDAQRCCLLLEADDFPPMVPVLVDAEHMISVCENTGNYYTIITPDELVIPPSY